MLKTKLSDNVNANSNFLCDSVSDVVFVNIILVLFLMQPSERDRDFW